MMEKIEIGGVPCWYKRMEAKPFTNALRKCIGLAGICPLCGKDVYTGGQIYMFLNNFKLFPNRLCHAGCVEEKGVVEVVRTLANDYAKAKASMEQASLWFENGEEN